MCSCDHNSHTVPFYTKGAHMGDEHDKDYSDDIIDSNSSREHDGSLHLWRRRIMSKESFESISGMDLKHLSNNSRLHLQRQSGQMIPEDAVQFGMPTSFVNEKGHMVWVRGPSIRLEQLPELIDMLSEAYRRYSDKPGRKGKKMTGTFADLYNDE